MNIALAILVFLGAYLLGNLSPSTLIARSRGIDIKKAGSGNAGTTNALRVLGKKAAIETLLIDIGKGVLAVVVAHLLLPEELAMWSALAVFVGHVWPVLLKFQGGKGVATGFGALLAEDWQIALICLFLFVAIVAVTRMVSLGSSVAAVALLIGCWFWRPDFFWTVLIMVAIMLLKHRSNMVRLIKGKENKLSFAGGEAKEKEHPHG